MVTYRYEGKTGRRYTLDTSDEHIAVRTRNREAIAEARPFEVAPLSAAARNLLAEFELVAAFREAGVEVLRSRRRRNSRALRDAARKTLSKEPAIRFAGRVLVDARSARPVLYTENFFVKFADDVPRRSCRALLKSRGLAIKRELDYARNAYFVAAPEGTGLETFDIAERLLKDNSVELCHPELVRETRARQAFTQQWHLKRTMVNGQIIDAHANVEAAWVRSDGTGTIVAIIDDGVDIDHDEFRSSNKIVAPRDVTRGTGDPRPGNRNNHGTACAGVAVASGRFGASGVAPGARLMPIRLASGLGSQAEADAFIWAAQHGADVISCSWGPFDGDFTDPTDPLHHEFVPLPDSTRLAIDFAITHGRNGKGCVICFAAGNGNESVDNDGYASNPQVIAVAACNDSGKKSAYSDFGRAVWCAFPSNHGFPSKTSGIWTTDRSGPLGYNLGTTSAGDIAGNYTNSFGGTSSACPGIAGVAALILARNPNLRWDEVRDVVRRGCDRIDAAGGNYDASGRSPFYGFGRVNARTAVDLALPAQPGHVEVRSAIQDIVIKDLQTAQLPLQIADTDRMRALRVSVDIEHTYIGDLIVSLAPPLATGVGPIILHNRQGGGTDNLKRTYDVVNAPALAALTGKRPQGKWMLQVADRAKIDVGRIRSLSLELHL